MVHIFTIDKGKQFVAGLFWQPLSAEARTEIPSLLKGAGPSTTKLASELDMDLAVWRTAGILQVGFASSVDGAKPGQYSAAALISKSIEIDHGGARDFLCAAEIGGGKWIYVAQRDGVILPDGDQVGTEDEIKSRMLSDLSLGDWGLLFAPDYWGISNAVERSFIQFVPKNAKGQNTYHRWWRLAPVKANLRKPMIYAGTAAVALTVAMVGYNKWQAHQALLEAQRLAALEAANQEAALSLPPPWEAAPKAHVFWNGCFDAFSAVRSLWPGNWEPKDATCMNGTFTVAWQRGEYGWIEHMRAVEPEAVLSTDGTVATVTVPIELQPAGQGDTLPVERERVLVMHSAAQRYGFDVVMSAAPTAPALPGQEGAAPAALWREVQWAVKGSALPPSVVLAALDGDGFRVTRVSAEFEGGIMKWTMEGSQYVQP